MGLYHGSEFFIRGTLYTTMICDYDSRLRKGVICASIRVVTSVM